MLLGQDKVSERTLIPHWWGGGGESDDPFVNTYPLKDEAMLLFLMLKYLKYLP